MELSSLEQRVMLAIVRLHPNAYGISIQDALAIKTAAPPSLGSVYAALERLEEKGFISNRQGEPTAERGGRRKLYFTVTARGQHTLRRSLQEIDALRRGLKWKEAIDGTLA